MDLNCIENRLMILECLKENAHNMLVEQVQLRDRISMVLGRARNTLASIRVLNTQVREMKVTVENALAANMEMSSNENKWGMIEGDSVEEPMEAIEEEEILAESSIEMNEESSVEESLEGSLENSRDSFEDYSVEESVEKVEEEMLS